MSFFRSVMLEDGPEICLVVFDVEGEIYHMEEVPRHHKVTRPPDPYEGCKWYGGLWGEFDFDTPITEDLLLWAWN